MKYFLVYITFGVVMTGLLAVYFFGNSLQGGSQESFTQLPIPSEGGTAPVVIDKAWSRNPGALPVPSAEVVGDSHATKLADNFYTVTEDRDIYTMYYYELNHSLSITLYQVPLEFSRALAERKLRAMLKAPEEELCTMNIEVVTNSFVDSRYAGVNLGLSFCAGSVVLE